MTEHEVIIEFELKDDKITNSTDRIIEAFEEIKSSFSGNVDKSMSEGLAKMADKSKKAAKPLKEIKKSAKGAALVMGVLATKAGIYTKKAIQLAQGSAEFIGTQTKFNAIFDRSNGELEQAQKWVDNYAKSLMLDNKVVMDTVSNFKLFANTLGLSNEKAKEITFNMTQLAHDMAAVAGVDVSTMSQKINSALAGQTKALKEYGISLDSNSLQQTLYQNNIKRTVASLNSAEKAELIYTQIMKQTAGQQGYLAKTMLSPANAANIVKTQFTLLGRSIGNLVLPILMKLLPVVVAVTQALTRMAEALAAFFGIKINFSDYGADIGGISAGIDGIGESADGTSKKIKNMLRDFDDLHVVDFGDDSGSGGGIGGGIGGGGLGLEAQQYADWSKYLSSSDEQLNKIKSTLERILPIISGIVTLISISKIKKLVENIKELWKFLGENPFVSLIIGISLVTSGFFTMKNAIKDIVDNGPSFQNIVELCAGAVLTFAGTLLILKAASKWNIMGLGGLGLAALSKIAITVTIVIGLLSYAVENLKDVFNRGRDASDSLAKAVIAISVAIGIVTVVASPIVGLIAAIVLGVVLLIGSIQTMVQSIKSIKDPTVEVLSPFENLSENLKGLSDKFKTLTGDVSEFESSSKNDYANILNNTKLTTEGIDKYLTEDMRNSLGLSTQQWEEYKQSISSNLSNANLDISKNLTDINNNINTNVNNPLKNSKSVWQDYQNGALSSMEQVATSISAESSNASNSLDALSKDSKTYSDEVKKNLSSISDAKIKKPKFSWSLATKAVGTVAKVLAALSMPTLLPTLSVSWFAEGGFPDKGDLFIANEREPELIGTMGNKTTVANGMQIIEGIASASYTGMKRALQEVDWGSGDTLVYVGNKQLTDVVTKQQNFNNKKYGR